jgi:uncharacterized protein with GYD domain
LEAFYFAFGDTDVFAIVDFADNVSAAATSLAGNATAAVDVKATALITAEEMDEAAQKSQGLPSTRLLRNHTGSYNNTGNVV